MFHHFIASGWRFLWCWRQYFHCSCVNYFIFICSTFKSAYDLRIDCIVWISSFRTSSCWNIFKVLA